MTMKHRALFFILFIYLFTLSLQAQDKETEESSLGSSTGGKFSFPQDIEVLGVPGQSSEYGFTDEALDITISKTRNGITPSEFAQYQLAINYAMKNDCLVKLKASDDGYLVQLPLIRTSPDNILFSNLSRPIIPAMEDFYNARTVCEQILREASPGDPEYEFFEEALSELNSRDMYPPDAELIITVNIAAILYKMPENHKERAELEKKLEEILKNGLPSTQINTILITLKDEMINVGTVCNKCSQDRIEELMQDYRSYLDSLPVHETVEINLANPPSEILSTDWNNDLYDPDLIELKRQKINGTDPFFTKIEILHKEKPLLSIRAGDIFGVSEDLRALWFSRIFDSLKGAIEKARAKSTMVSIRQMPYAGAQLTVTPTDVPIDK